MSASPGRPPARPDGAGVRGLARRPLPRRLGLFAAALLLALPLPGAVALEHVAIDPVRYFSMARFVADHGRLGREVKERFLETSAVSREGPTEFPPLFPLVAGAAVAVRPELRSVQVLNAVVMTSAVILLAALTRRLLGSSAALLVVVLWIAWPESFWLTVMGWNEPVALLLTAATLALAFHARPGPLAAAAIGSLVALAHLARPELLVLAPCLALFRTFRRPAGWRLRVFREALPLLGTALALTLAFIELQDAAFPERVLSQAFLYRVRSDQQVFVLTNIDAARDLFGSRDAWERILPEVAFKVGGYGLQLAAAVGVPLVLAAFAAWHGRRRGRAAHPSREALLLFGPPTAGLLLLHVVTWSVPVLWRYFALPLFVGLPLVAGAVAAALRPPTADRVRVLVALGLAVFLLPGLARHGHRTLKSVRLGASQPRAYFLETQRSEWTDPEFAAAARRLGARAPGGPLAAANPWLLNFLTGEPAMLAPQAPLTAAALDVARAVPLRGWLDSPFAREWIVWPAAGVSRERVGRYVVHDCGPGRCRPGGGRT